ncbi:hypothetical protein OHA98_42485 [Streptomyces sp. NBC_00654]|uniref:hypothetical protein n=1 Tax=Streptomyces sp. NBC_00654 TaxID=2975799 RepID=UPI002256F11A|nr:hypothetical protein [Streptomyces sp. NBC_00654]MCX4971269.1 hypothetical protein [Streptomyces sp. NBC_00654]
MTDDEQQLAALLNDLPGHDDAQFWHGLEEAAGIYRIRSNMSCAVKEARDGNFGPLAGFVFDVFNHDARLKDITAAVATHLGSTLRAQAWITDAIAASDRVNRTHAGDPLEELTSKW